MTVKLMNEHHLEAAQTYLMLHMSKCHIVGNHMLRLKVQCTISLLEQRLSFTNSLITDHVQQYVRLDLVQNFFNSDYIPDKVFL